MDNPEDDGWRWAWMDWVKKRQRCQIHLATEGSAEKRLGVGALFVVVTIVTSAVTTLCVLERWSGGEERKWNGAKEEVLGMVGKEINIQLNRFGPKIHFTLQASTRNDDEGVLIGWRNAQYSLSEDRAYVVPSTDYYMIYTCLSFLAPPSDEVYWQELWRHPQSDASRKTVVMKDVQTERCDQQSGTASTFCRRSLIFGILKLRRDDRIYVRTNHPNLVSRTNGTSYFGVLKMS